MEETADRQSALKMEDDTNEILSLTTTEESCSDRSTESAEESNQSSAKSIEIEIKAEDDGLSRFKQPSAFAVPLSVGTEQQIQSLKSKKKIESIVVNSVNNNNNGSSDTDNESFQSPQAQPSRNVNYEEPEWSGNAESNYSFDVLKNGSIINNVPLTEKPFFVFGRLPSCDVTLEHPSLSRHHAVIQYSTNSSPNTQHEKGWYIYDLDSTHGTWVNKKKIRPLVYHRIKVGHIVKFGGSSRLHILQGPDDDQDNESEMSITEMKEQKEKQKKEAELLRLSEKQEEDERAERNRKIMEDEGCAWGMGDDAEDVGGDNPFASLTAQNENLYIDDPKKALKGFYEREGLDLPDYQFPETSGGGNHKCTLDIPMDGPNGEELIAEAVVSGKKKDAVIACALEACRMLDKLGMLRSSTHQSQKRKAKNWEDNDFYDSDEDTFLDRTGTIEKKRTMRMKKVGKDVAESYDSLVLKYTKVTESIAEIERKLEKAKADAEVLANEELDELEAYMASIKSGVMDSKTRLHLKGELLRLKMDEQNLRRLVNIAKPASLPPLKPYVPLPSQEKVSTTESLSRKLQHLQKQKQQQKRPLPVKQTMQSVKSDNYEEEDDDDDHDDNSSCTQEVKNTSSSQSRLSDDFQAANEKRSKRDRNPEVQPSESSESLKRDFDLDKSRSKMPCQYFSTSATLATMGKKQPQNKNSKRPHPPHSQVDLDTLDPKYATWLPPQEQSGDGRTSLNDKLGY